MEIYNPNKHDKTKYDLIVEIDRSGLFDDHYYYYLHIKSVTPRNKLHEVIRADKTLRANYLLFEGDKIPNGLIEDGVLEGCIVYGDKANQSDICKIKEELLSNGEIQTTGWRGYQVSSSY